MSRQSLFPIEKARCEAGWVEPMKNFASEIYAAVRARRLAEPFGAEDVESACPGWSERTYRVFLSKHAGGNPGKNTELFERVRLGRYRLTR